MTRLHILATASFLAASTLTSTAPASAQDYPPPLPVVQPLDDFGDEIVVYGRYRSLPSNVEHLSQRVSYRDLDLYYADDRRELRRRVSFTARYLCDRLGEGYSSSIGPTCRDAATRDAMRRVGDGGGGVGAAGYCLVGAAEAAVILAKIDRTSRTRLFRLI